MHTSEMEDRTVPPRHSPMNHCLDMDMISFLFLNSWSHRLLTFTDVTHTRGYGAQPAADHVPGQHGGRRGQAPTVRSPLEPIGGHWWPSGGFLVPGRGAVSGLVVCAPRNLLDELRPRILQRPQSPAVCFSLRIFESFGIRAHLEVTTKHHRCIKLPRIETICVWFQY